MIAEIWDSFIEQLEYLISFEWFSDIGEFFSGFFEDLGEFSAVGLLHGFVLSGLTFYVIGKLAFIQNSPVPSKVGYYFVLMLITFIYGYLLGKRVWD